jgi:hypothetical protein
MQAGEVVGDNLADIFGEGYQYLLVASQTGGGHVWSAYESGQGILCGGLFICLHRLFVYPSHFGVAFIVCEGVWSWFW